MVHSHLGEQTLEPRSLLDGSPAAALVFVDDEDPIPRPTESGSMIRKGVLALSRFLMVENLLHAGLADVDDRQFAEMWIGYRSGALAKSSRDDTRRYSFPRCCYRRMADAVMIAHASPPEPSEAL